MQLSNSARRVGHRRVHASTRLLCLVISSVVGASACSPAVDTPFELDHSSWSPIRLASEVVNQDPALGLPTDIVVWGEVLAVSDLSGDPYLHIISRASGERLASFGRRGEGPGEFGTVPTLLGTIPGTDTLLLFDPMLQRLTVLPPRTSVAGDEWAGRAGPVIEPPGALDIGLLAEGNLLVAKWDAELGIRLNLHDPVGKRIVEGSPIDLLDARLPPGELASGYSLMLCPHTSTPSVAVAYRYAGRLDLFGPDVKVAGSARVPFSFLPHLEPNPVTGKLAFKSGEPGTRRAYSSCTSTSDELLALFWGRRREPATRKWPEMTRSYIHVFDWNGELKRVLELDHGAGAITVDSTGRFLYSIAREESAGGVAVHLTRLPERWE